MYTILLYIDQKLQDILFHVQGILCGSKPQQHPSLFVTYELSKIPLYSCGPKIPWRLFLEEAPQGILSGSVDVYFVKEDKGLRKRYPLLLCDEVSDFTDPMWLLLTELIAWKSQYDETFVLVLVI